MVLSLWLNLIVACLRPMWVNEPQKSLLDVVFFFLELQLVGTNQLCPVC